MEVLVTGGAGFIGSSVVRSLLADGHRVRAFDDLSTGSLDNLHDIPAVTLVMGDIRDPDAVREAMDGAEVVYHFAALPSVARSIADPILVNGVNVDGTLNVLTAARDAGVRRLVYASSSSVYGDTPTMPKHEDMAVHTLSPYAASKFAGEAYCRAFTRVYGLETVSLRFFNVFGPRQDPASEYAAVIPRFATAMLAGQSPTVFGDGLQSRDFTFIDNVIDACKLAASAGPDAAGEAMNVACARRITLLELIDQINGQLGTDIRPTFGQTRIGDVKHSLASIEKAERLIGYRPRVPVRDGLAATVKWFEDQLAVSGARAASTTTDLTG